jgi:predicted AAA+ superfamily ATPase
MVSRSFWSSLLSSAWERKTAVWLAGVRGVGKTSFCQALWDAEFFDCESPRVRRLMADPEEFWRKLRGKKVVLDEIHRLPNAFPLLKTAAERFPSSRLLVTAPVSLQANPNVREALGERLAQIWLTPMMSQDLVDFGNIALEHRFLRGGLPSFFASPTLPEWDFQQWMDSFWAKDIQDFFRIEQRDSFHHFMELLSARSGELFEAVRYTDRCGVSRTTIRKYLQALETSLAVLVVRPFSTRRAVEIVTIPQTYVFDTGFLCYSRGWQNLREGDFGILWKHYVLNEICAHLQDPQVQYWRDKRGHEVDFILIDREWGVITMTCLWKARDFTPRGLQAFRYHYPSGPNWVVCGDAPRASVHSLPRLKVEFMSLKEMIQKVSARPHLEQWTPQMVLD